MTWIALHEIEASNNFKGLLEKYHLDYDFLKAFIKKAIGYINQKEREEFLKKYRRTLKTFKKISEEKPHLFTIEEKLAICTLNEETEFSVFGATKGAGRSHDIPEAGLIWNLSLVIRKSENEYTNWEDLKEVLSFFSPFCSTLKNLAEKNNDDLRRLKTKFAKKRKLAKNDSDLFLRQQAKKRRLEGIQSCSQKVAEIWKKIKPQNCI